jgi:hypothetical protein
LHWEALQRGLGRAQWILVVGNGAPWIWNVAADRWANAEEMLDFYHASEHLWVLGRALFGEDQAKEWVESHLHELRHGEEEGFLVQTAELKAPRGQRGKQNRFKPRGQFWTHEGLGNLAALKGGRENKHWDELWFAQ